MDIFRGVSPLTGTWEVARTESNGIELEPSVRTSRYEIVVDGDHARVAWYWTCGAEKRLADGVMARKGNRIDLYREIAMTPELEQYPNGSITVLDNGHLEYDASDADGTLHLEFRRSSNASALLDLIGWH